MAHINRDIFVHADADQVWAAIRDVGAVHQRLARGFVVATRLDGNARIVTFTDGTTVRERIIDVDDNGRRLEYSIVGGRATYHRASMQVVADGDGGSRVVWNTHVLPDSLAAIFDAAMAKGCDAMKTTLEACVDPAGETEIVTAQNRKEGFTTAESAESDVRLSRTERGR